MKPILILALGLLGLVPAPAQETRLVLDWRSGPGPGESRVPVSVDGRMALRIENTNRTALQVNLARLEHPPLEARVYALRGEVRYEQVQGDAFLELWNQFPPATSGAPAPRYFSRTLGLSGPMGKLSGTSGWRPFELPFDPTGASGAPTELEFNLHLPGPGLVWIGPVTLVQYRASGWAPAGAWWSPRTTGVIGGVVGGTVGTLAGIAGALMGRGRGRGFVVPLFLALTGLGALSLLAGAVALALRQPFHVSGTLLFTGALLLGIIPLQLRQCRRRYAERELRRMQAADAG